MAQSNNILQELKELGSSLADQSVQEVYSVPAGYFDDLAETVLKRIRMNSTDSAAEEIELISPILKGISKEMPYQVPQGYFDNLSRPKAKIVSFTKSTWFRIAAAAVITGVVFLIGYLSFGPEAGERKAEQVFARLSKDIKKMTETQKDNMIEYIDAGMSAKEMAQMISKSSEVKEILQDIPEAELKLFQEQSEDIEDVLMIN